MISATASVNRVLALVESPAQLLNVIEWAYAGLSGRAADVGSRLGSGITVLILAPTQPQSRDQLIAMASLAADRGFDICWQDVRSRRPERVRALGVATLRLRQPGTLIIGDPFSGLQQLLLSIARASQVIVVDDGTATLEFADLISSNRQLLRWHKRRHSSALTRRLADKARQRLMPGGRPDFALFTAMPVAGASFPVRTHTLDWTRQTFGPPSVLPGADLVGTSLVETGVIGLPHYLRAVDRLGRQHDVRRYLAHRRESTDKLTRIAELGLEIVRPDLPLEIFARCGPISETVISFPSTVVHTLPSVLRDVDVQLLVCDIDQGWFTAEHHTPAANRFLSGITDSAQRSYGLTSIAA